MLIHSPHTWGVFIYSHFIFIIYFYIFINNWFSKFYLEKLQNGSQGRLLLITNLIEPFYLFFFGKSHNFENRSITKFLTDSNHYYTNRAPFSEEITKNCPGSPKKLFYWLTSHRIMRQKTKRTWRLGGDISFKARVLRSAISLYIACQSTTYDYFMLALMHFQWLLFFLWAHYFATVFLDYFVGILDFPSLLLKYLQSPTLLRMFLERFSSRTKPKTELLTVAHLEDPIIRYYNLSR